MSKEPLVFLQHILESIIKVDTFVKNISEEDFLKDEFTQSAVIRQIEIIGEAAKNLPAEFVVKYKQVPWKEIIATRDKIIHHYFGVDIALIWDIVKNDLPSLKNQIEKIIKEARR